MDQFLDTISSSNGLALLISAAIFLVTVTLIVKRLIGLVMTIALLFFAVVSGLAIANNDIVREHFQFGKKGELIPFARKESGDSESRLNQFKQRLWSIIEQLVETLSNQNEGQADDSVSARQLRSSVEDVIQQLDAQRHKLQAFLDNQSTSDLRPGRSRRY